MTSDLNLTSFEEVLSAAENGSNAVIVASGGLDSAYCLWKYSQVVTDRPIVCHHINMYPSKADRTEAELLALQNQLDYLGKDKFQLNTTTIDVCNNSPYSRMSDWYLTAMLSINVALHSKCQYIVIGDDLPDSYDRAQPHTEMDQWKKKSFIAIGEVINSLSQGKVKLCTAMETNDLSVKYMEMPAEYQQLTFSCRTPIKTKYFYNACGKCNSCIKNNHFGWWNKVGKQVKILP